jgi:Tol biopolymer transport system component
VYIGSLDSQERKFLVNTAFKAIFAPPEHLLFLRETTLMAQPFDPERLELSGEPFPVAEGVGSFTANSAAGFTVSKNGIIAYRTGASAGTTFLTWVDRSGRDIGTVGVPAGYQNHVLSPELQRIAVGRVEGSTGDLWIIDLIRGPMTRFTFDPGLDTAPLWSPDGKQIVFSSNRGNAAFDLYQKNSSGVGQEELLFKSDHSKLAEHWSADGRFLLFRDLDPQTRDDLWILPMTGDKKPEPVIRSAFVDFQGRFSPDGHWIAYVSNESGQPQVYLQGFPTAGSKTQISTSGGFQPRWRGDGKELLFISPAREAMAVDVSVSNGGALKIGVPQKLFSINPINLTTYRNTWEVTPDGQRFLINSGQQQATPSIPITFVVNWRSGLTTRN